MTVVLKGKMVDGRDVEIEHRDLGYVDRFGYQTAFTSALFPDVVVTTVGYHQRLGRGRRLRFSLKQRLRDEAKVLSEAGVDVQSLEIPELGRVYA